MWFEDNSSYFRKKFLLETRESIFFVLRWHFYWQDLFSFPSIKKQNISRTYFLDLLRIKIPFFFNLYNVNYLNRAETNVDIYCFTKLNTFRIHPITLSYLECPWDFAGSVAPPRRSECYDIWNEIIGTISSKQSKNDGNLSGFTQFLLGKP